jgi:outer membrane lipoprotein-sorting protein
MTKTAFITAALLLSTLPALAQIKPLTPPDVLGAARTVQFTATLYKIGDPAGFYLIGDNKTPIRTFTVMLAQPNKALIVDTNEKTKAVEAFYASDGKTQKEYLTSANQSVKSDAPAQISEINFRTLGLFGFADFYDTKAFAQFKDFGAVGIKGNLLNHCYLLSQGTVNGPQTYEVIVVDHKTGLPLYASISVDAKLPDEYGSGTHDGSREVERIEFSHWKLNAPVDDSKFAYTPPAGATRNQ